MADIRPITPFQRIQRILNQSCEGLDREQIANIHAIINVVSRDPSVLPNVTIGEFTALGKKEETPRKMDLLVASVLRSAFIILEENNRIKKAGTGFTHDISMFSASESIARSMAQQQTFSQNDCKKLHAILGTAIHIVEAEQKALPDRNKIQTLSTGVRMLCVDEILAEARQKLRSINAPPPAGLTPEEFSNIRTMVQTGQDDEYLKPMIGQVLEQKPLNTDLTIYAKKLLDEQHEVLNDTHALLETGRDVLREAAKAAGFELETKAHGGRGR